jgi:hypothetical protein
VSGDDSVTHSGPDDAVQDVAADEDKGENDQDVDHAACHHQSKEAEKILSGSCM